MSHAANIRNRQQHQQQRTHRSPHSVVPAKRRKSPSPPLDRKQNGVSTLVNGTFTGKAPAAVPTNDAKRRSYAQTDESRVVVQQGGKDDDVVDAVESSSEEGESSPSSSEDDSDDSEKSESESEEPDKDQDDSDGQTRDKKQLSKQSGKAAAETAKAGGNDSADEEEGSDDDDEAAFGELIRTGAPEPISVDVSFAEDNSNSKSLDAPSERRQLSVPSATSLGTVLTQALRTNDTELLESCLQTHDLNSIRATIERLQSQFAVTLLEKLAERLHKRPGRAGSLMVWVQWTIVAHGAYLASRPTAMKQLNTLYQVVKQRATGLQPLLALKGKLDMLEAQMQLRKNMQIQSRDGKSLADDDDEEGVIYVEGEEDQKQIEEATSRSLSKTAQFESSSDEEEDDMPSMPNGFDNVDEDDDDEEGDEDDLESNQSNLIDDEAEESSAESNELSDEIDMDDDDEEPSESEEETRPTKSSKQKPKANRK